MGGCPTPEVGSAKEFGSVVPGACRLARFVAGSTPPEFGRLAEQRPGAVTSGGPGGLRLANRRGLELKARA
jgi:hypothetical protein